jgi:DNA polymerase-3 subunit epsilon
MKFLNFELTKANLPAIPMARATDTLMMARRKFPGSPATLDALCRRFGVDNSAREKHGALLDSEILAEVYLELVGGRQPDFGLNPASQTNKPNAAQTDSDWRPRPRPTALPSRLTPEESAAHTAFVDKIGDAAIWKKRH